MDSRPAAERRHACGRVRGEMRTLARRRGASHRGRGDEGDVVAPAGYWCATPARNARSSGRTRSGVSSCGTWPASSMTTSFEPVIARCSRSPIVWGAQRSPRRRFRAHVPDHRRGSNRHRCRAAWCTLLSLQSAASSASCDISDSCASGWAGRLPPSGQRCWSLNTRSASV